MNKNSNYKKSKTLIVFSTVFITLMLSFPTHSIKTNIEESDQKSYSNYLYLRQKALTEGNVKIIIKLLVPNIDELTAASNNFGTVEPGLEHTWGGYNADRALAEAIEFVAEEVLFDLNMTYYEVNHIYLSIPYMALNVSVEALEILQNLPIVLDILEDKPIELIMPVTDGNEAKGENTTTSTNDLDSPQLDNTVSIIGADTAWSMGYTGSGRYVAILDTGIRKTHEFFTGKTIVEACYALGEDGVGGAGDCPNGFAIMTGSGSAAHHPNTYQGWDHGTHVSGIATGNYGTLYGVAKDANIISVQVFSKFSAGYCGGTPCVLSWNSDQLAGLDYVYSIRGSYSISSVNMSLGGGAYSSNCDSDTRKATIDNLRAAGIATAIATGNNGYCGYISSPSCISTAVSVGSSTDADQESGFNNWHATLQELFAPGSSVYSSTGDSDSSYESWNGTSMATPHVAGAWALIKQALPSGTVSGILSVLQSTGVPITSVCDGYTMPIPRIQIDAAISALTSEDFVEIIVGDFDSDGLNDDLAGITVTGKVKYTTNLSTWITISGRLETMVSGDFDSDVLNDDLAGLNSTGMIWYTTNLSSWTNIPGRLVTLVSGDFDSDGLNDDLAGINNTGMIWYTTNLSSWINIPGRLVTLVSGDFDGDGLNDDLAGINATEMIWYTTNLSSWTNIRGRLVTLVSGDFDSDGLNDDLAGINATEMIWYTTNLSSWTNIPGRLVTLISGDFDSNGLNDDIAGINNTGMIWYTTNLSSWINILGYE
jgi:subtilisin family serine protease